MKKFKLKNKTAKALDLSALILVIVGALNWGLAVFRFNLVQFLANNTFRALEMIIYAIVGVAGLWLVWALASKRLKLKR